MITLLQEFAMLDDDPEKQPNYKTKIIKCKCGQEILLLPDIKAMSRAISAHAILHAEKENDPEKAEATREQYENYLVEQVLKALTKK